MVLEKRRRPILIRRLNWPVIENNHNQTKSIGTRKPNELGIYDMSGNVREWCWDWYGDLNSQSGTFRVVKGGGWIGDVSNNEISFRGKFDANGFGRTKGFESFAERNRGASRSDFNCIDS